MSAARYKPYPAYKPSYAAWSGDVPDHWSPIRLKHVFAEKKKVHNPALPAGSISFGNVIYKNEESLAKETKAAYQELRCGEFLINPLNMNYDLLSLRTALSSIDVVVSTGYMILQSAEGYDKNYLRWLLQQFDVAHMKTLGAGVRQTISYADIGNSFIFQPSPTEQTKIAAFLDFETGKIDALIAKQERLIALLEEKRQAVISHAVTKGLNPTAPLRPSGIDWLGDVPEHWEVKSLKNLITETSSISYGIVQPGDALDTGVPFVQTTNMTTGDFDLLKLQKTLPSIAAQFPRSKLHGGEVLLGIRASIGAAHIVPDFLKGANLSRGVARIECAELVSPDFLVQFFRSKSAEQYWNLGKQGSTFNEVSIATVRELKISLPPQAEQADIVDFLAAKNAVFDALDAQAQSANALLKERRTALISAAVTGKIDVRDWQPRHPLSDTDLSAETLQEAAL
jgi:type I restriction enzyme S subunit